MPLGVVIRRKPGVTRWAKWAWKAVGVLPGAGDADWRELRRDGESVEFHAATPLLELHGAETDAYVHGLAAQVPCVYVVLRRASGAGAGRAPLDVVLVTASPYEAQDYCDSGEEIVEKVAMPDGLVAWVQDFIDQHHIEEEFKKRRRDRVRTDKVEHSVGDPRVRQLTDVYLAPQARKERMN
ncbi:MAG: DUF3305 domain-containing protein [Pseudomonadota bacterium]|uniref:DUF3305 domain-containing protein n=1 Tax=Roseovarius TaxID=74030 RepID=UPI0022A84265|nr:DUF3305 domain-containing protein [Roseovarius sp. EGI FJ00037]MCZ0812708.1 DUF3305 domain-containing protein [Roseovarius sp. EGI FJ00037]